MGFNIGSGELVASEVYSSADAVSVDIQSYSVEVQTHAEDTVRVEVYETGFSTAPVPVIAQNGGDVSVTQGHGFGINLGGGKVLISVPADSALSYTLKTVSGSVRLEAASQSAVLHSVSGSIRASGGGRSVDAGTVSGSIRIFDPYDTVSCKSTSGSIRTSADQDTASITANSVSGSVRVRMTGVTGYRMDYSSVSGSIRDEYHDLRYNKNGRGAWGDESLRLDLRTTSGSIKLEDWSD